MKTKSSQQAVHMKAIMHEEVNVFQRRYARVTAVSQLLHSVF